MRPDKTNLYSVVQGAMHASMVTNEHHQMHDISSIVLLAHGDSAIVPSVDFTT